MSASGGLENAVQAAVETQCDSLQVFVKNQRQWAAPPLSEDQINTYKSAAGRSGLRPVVAHASYLLNLASNDKTTRTRSINALADEHQRCEQLGIDALIFHPGAHLDDTPRAGIKRIAQGLNQVREQATGQQCTILLETTAGQGTSLGHRFEQLADILAAVRHLEHLGVCLDTCHLFAAGYDFRTQEGYLHMIEQMESAIGLACVKCIHANDSKRELGSRVDRHEHVGKGKIGKGGFANFVNDPNWSELPFILETPKGKDGRGTNLDKVNLKRLRGLLQSR